MDGTTPALIEQPANVPALSETASVLAIIAKAAADPNTDVLKLEKLLDMHERITTKQAEIAFNQALARLAPLMPRIKKNGVVEYAIDKNNKSGPKEKAFNFATYEDIDKGIRPFLSEEGFSLSFTSEPRTTDGGGCILHGKLSHVGGHSRTASISLALDSSGGKNNLQAMASSTSYGKRYTTCMLLNIVTEGEDDDAKGANDVITIEQAVDIDVKLGEVKADKARFLKFMGVKDVREILALDHAKAINAIKAKAKT